MSVVRATRRRRWGVEVLLVGSVLAAAGPCDARAEGASPALPVARIAVLPINNLTGFAAILEPVRETLASDLREAGFDVVPDADLRAFLASRRVRYTGGLSHAVLGDLRGALASDLVLISTVDLLVEEAPPRISLAARAVRTSDGAIVWAGETVRAGEESPGLLGSREVMDASELARHAARTLTASLAAAIGAAGPTRAEGSSRAPTWAHAKPERRFRPRKAFRDDALDATLARPALVAVLPFEHLGGPDEAGDILMTAFAVHLAGRDGVVLIEPGEVREALLRNRVVQVSGLSLAQAEALRVYLGVDLVVTGEVLAYRDRGTHANPEVAFSVHVIDPERRAVVWSCLSTNRGDDGATLFGQRRERSARGLASRMVLAAAEAFVGGAKRSATLP